MMTSTLFQRAFSFRPPSGWCFSSSRSFFGKNYTQSGIRQFTLDSSKKQTQSFSTNSSLGSGSYSCLLFLGRSNLLKSNSKRIDSSYFTGLTRSAGNGLNFKHFFSTSSRSLLRYHPPQYRRPQSFLDRIPENTVFYGIIGINVTVFLMWYMSIAKYKHEGDPSAVLWMQSNFLSSWNNLTSGRLWTPITCCFSHQNLPHILMNTFTFFFMARPVMSILGTRQFILLYLGGGLVSSFASIVYAKIVGKYNYASHGASGAIYSIVSLLACVAPTMTFQLYGIIPVPAWLAVSGFFTWDLYTTLSEKNGTTDTVGHIGGILAGIGYFLGKRFRLF